MNITTGLSALAVATALYGASALAQTPHVAYGQPYETPQANALSPVKVFEQSLPPNLDQLLRDLEDARLNRPLTQGGLREELDRFRNMERLR